MRFYRLLLTVILCNRVFCLSMIIMINKMTEIQRIACVYNEWCINSDIKTCDNYVMYLDITSTSNSLILNSTHDLTLYNGG